MSTSEDELKMRFLAAPAIVPEFEKALNELVAVAAKGHKPGSEYFNPPDSWLLQRMRLLQDLPPEQQATYIAEFERLQAEAAEANAQGKAAFRAGPDIAVRLDSGGLAFFSQLGVSRRPDLTQYFIEGFDRNRDSLAFSEENQALFADVLPLISRRLAEAFAAGDTVVQTDRQVCDAPGRSYHARQLLFGTHYLQLPYMWRQLTFDLPDADREQQPDILEVSLPHWLEDVRLPQELIARIRDAGLTQLVFKAPTKGLSLHLGFDYMGEHKMGPLSIAMFKVKEAGGLALQAALSIVVAQILGGETLKTALVTAGPSLHGKSTLTVMIDLADSQLAERLGLERAPGESVYPMNDDIILLQPVKGSGRVPYSIDGTENSFYAVPFGLTREDDPITYDVLRGTPEQPNHQETLENTPVNPRTGVPNFLENPVRNMRMILSRERLLERKGVDRMLERITGGELRDSVHVPMNHIDRIFWQAVMRQNTVVPPLRRLAPAQYVRVLMYGEAVQMGAATGAIGRPYVEYFSDPFIIGLEDENANLLHRILQEMESAGVQQSYYALNTGGIGADSNDSASGARYKKIPREITLMLQEALLRGAVKFEQDPVLGSDVAVAIVDGNGKEILDLRRDWLPRYVYGEEEYGQRILELSRHRYYGDGPQDKAGILRYTKVSDEIIDIAGVPLPANERELAWLLSFYLHVDIAYNTLADLANHADEATAPAPDVRARLQEMVSTSLRDGLSLPAGAAAHLSAWGLQT
ncbi:MAG TPA: hypothetical protein VFB90_01160 [Dehalococcoidia bacterium]|nr:hypothetical protein [Dehalococcoidia bacterium]